MQLQFAQVFTLTLTILMVVMVGVYSGRKIKGSNDFSLGGNQAGAGIISGTVMGTLIGGASTIGTAQMAFLFGLSAWWFTLGAGLGCLALGLFYTSPMRKAGAKTIPEILFQEYGPQAGLFGAFITSAGMFVSIVAQVISLIALLTAMFQLNPYAAALIGVFLMGIYVVFGGLHGTGLVGLVKVVLLYSTVMLAGVIAYSLLDGLSGIARLFPPFPWFSLFGRGLEKDLSAGFSLVIGVISTQTCFQAVASGSSLKASRRGMWLSTWLIPPIGLAGILIGLFMRAHFPEVNPAEALPLFVLKYLNPWLGGIVLATLLISVIGAGAGLVLGIGTIIANDIYRQYFDRKADERRILKLTRLFICLVLGSVLLFVSGNLKSLILQWSFLAMGLRGASCFIPMTGALFFKGAISKRAGTLAVVFGPLSMICWEIFAPDALDSLFVGIGVSMLIIILGSTKKAMKTFIFSR